MNDDYLDYINKKELAKQKALIIKLEKEEYEDYEAEKLLLEENPNIVAKAVLLDNNIYSTIRKLLHTDTMNKINEVKNDNTIL